MNIDEEFNKILNDDFLTDMMEEEELIVSDLFNTSRYKGALKFKKNRHTRRKRMDEQTFNRLYKPLFLQVHADLESGNRVMKDFKSAGQNVDIIRAGGFYVQSGQVLYVHSIRNPATNEEVASSSNRDFRALVIFENGQYYEIPILTLLANLYSNARQGFRITEPKDQGYTFMGTQVVPDDGGTGDNVSGYIYVVRYMGKDPHILSIPNLYKVGVAKDLESRLSDTENESTYLYAPVKLVASFALYGVNAKDVERVIHHALADKQVQLTIKESNGRDSNPREWFQTTPQEVGEIVNTIITRLREKHNQ